MQETKDTSLQNKNTQKNLKRLNLMQTAMNEEYMSLKKSLKNNIVLAILTDTAKVMMKDTKKENNQVMILDIMKGTS